MASVEGTGTIKNVRFYYNLVRNVAGYALSLGHDGNPAATIMNTAFYQNTVYGCGTGLHYRGNATFSNNELRNNIIYCPAGNALYVYDGGSGLTINSNRFYIPAHAAFGYFWLNTYDYGGFRAASGQEADGSEGDPLFVNPAGGDYRLQPASAAIGMGAVISGIRQARHGSTADAGMYEYAPGRLGTPTAASSSCPSPLCQPATKLRNRHRASVYP
jgi:hypothetical protein